MSIIKITPEFAEILGIRAGDGYLRYEGTRKELDISGGYDEKQYYDEHVIPLFNKVFDISIKGKFFPSRNTYGFVIRDKKVLDTFKNIGFPSGSKSLIVRIPEKILKSNNKKIICSFLRGYFDTDGCLNFTNRKGQTNYPIFNQKYNYYPRIILGTVSNNLNQDLIKVFNNLEFNFHTRKRIYKQKNWNDRYDIYLVGKDNLIKWMNLIGIKNSTKFSRYAIWEKFGFCPTNITFDQRINIIEGKLNPYSLY